jgi:biotin operon repressor
MIDLIPIGAENAVLLKDLAAMVGKSPRQVQADIQSIREKDQINIISLATGGYCLPSSDDKGEREAKRYEVMMIRQAIGRLKKARLSMKWRAERNQMRFYTGEKLEEIESLLLTYLTENMLKKEGE